MSSSSARCCRETLGCHWLTAAQLPMADSRQSIGVDRRETPYPRRTWRAVSLPSASQVASKQYPYIQACLDSV